MPKPTKGNRLGGSPAHERIILANLASQLFEHGRITTTETRAKRVQPLAERLISKAKRGDLHNRRQVKQTITSAEIVHQLFAEIAPKMEGREGGYTRITKVGPRKGDNAPMAVIELITEPVTKAAPKKAAAKKATPQDKAITSDEAAAAAAPQDEVREAADYGENSFRGEEAPEGFDIKGNEDSMLYHTPDSPYYAATKAEVWFNSTEAAEAAGFAAPASQADAETDEPAEA